MNNIFYLIDKTTDDKLSEMYSTNTVAYISLLETIGIVYDESTDVLLSDWDKTCRSKGMNNFYSSNVSFILNVF